MNGEQAILSRRSCRKFQHKEVPRELIEKLISWEICPNWARSTKA